MHRSLSVLLSAVLCLLLVVPGVALAAAPGNDTPAAAMLVDRLPFTDQVDLGTATDTDGDGLPPCEAGASHRVWYRYVAESNESIAVSASGNRGVEIAFWSDEPAPQLLGCAVDGRDLVRPIDAGTSRLISVGMWTSDTPYTGPVEFSVQPPPVNDAFADAIAIGPSGLSDEISRNTMRAATREPGEPVASCHGASELEATAWYRLEATEPTAIDVVHPNRTALYAGTAVGALDEVACATSGRLHATLDPGIYHVQVLAEPDAATRVSILLAGRPVNDDLADAVTVGALPYQTTVDLGAATTEPGEPIPSCWFGIEQTVWYAFAPAAPGIVRVSASEFSSSLGVYAVTGPGTGGLAQVTCAAFGSPNALTFSAQAGVRYAIQVGLTSAASPGPFDFSIEAVAPPANDAFADAEAIEAPFVGAQVDMTGATLEAGEPTACGSAAGTVWYRFEAPADGLWIARSTGTQATLGAFRGSSPGSLELVACGGGAGVVLDLAAGDTAWLQLGATGFGSTSFASLSLEEVGPPSASFAWTPGDPSRLDEVGFVDTSFDPAGLGIVTWSWAFGDGATSTDPSPTHRYAADGTYTVHLTVKTVDGRAASTSNEVTVATHDVGIVDVTAPRTAAAGREREIVVTLENAGAERAQVDLYRVDPHQVATLVGSKTVDLKAGRPLRITDVAFRYTFTTEDASIGKTTFQAIVTLASGRDAFTPDNLGIVTTRVTS